MQRWRKWHPSIITWKAWKLFHVKYLKSILWKVCECVDQNYVRILLFIGAHWCCSYYLQKCVEITTGKRLKQPEPASTLLLHNGGLKIPPNPTPFVGSKLNLNLNLGSTDRSKGDRHQICHLLCRIRSNCPQEEKVPSPTLASLCFTSGSYRLVFSNTRRS